MRSSTGSPSASTEASEKPGCRASRSWFAARSASEPVFWQTRARRPPSSSTSGGGASAKGASPPSPPATEASRVVVSAIPQAPAPPAAPPARRTPLDRSVTTRAPWSATTRPRSADSAVSGTAPAATHAARGTKTRQLWRPSETRTSPPRPAGVASRADTTRTSS